MTVTRLFRAHTPSDAACAAIVANSLPPGHNVLAVCADKATVHSDGYLACMYALARVHEWSAVVDVSGVPVNRPVPADDSMRKRWRRFRDTLESLTQLRRLLAPAFGIATDRGIAAALDRGVRELYVACLYHPDIEALFQILPSARKVYYPHTFDSFTRHETADYAHYFAPAAGRFWQPAALKNGLKRLLLGADAVPLRRLTLDAACTFNYPVPWASEQLVLADRINQATMQSIFSQLPDEVRAYYTGLAQQCGPHTGILLLSPENWFEEWRLDKENVLLARHLVTLGASRILVKPHPRSHTNWIDGILDRLRQELPAVALTVVDRFYYYPVEVVLAPFRLTASAAIMSTSLGTLRRIYGIPGYCPMARLRDRFAAHRTRLAVIDQWLAEYAGQFTDV